MGNPEQTAEQLFEAALELPPEERAAFLDHACDGTPQVRQIVEQLLAEDQRLGSFLGISPLHVPSSGSGPALAAGSKLGRYTVIEPLGAGGMGVVYRGFDTQLERDVAIKILASGLLLGEEARKRFRREALVLAKLSHPNIAPIYDVGQQDGIDYIVMECVAGESLAARIRSGPFSVKEATSILLQIAEALEEAHEQGVIHRDLKPANVMITPRGQVKVLDFGIAKLLANEGADTTVTLLETRGIIGTPLYMSPEQIRGESIDIRTDLWNLGVIYYELLTCKAPFSADNHLSIFRAVTEDAPVPARKLRTDLPPTAEQILARALDKDRTSRYQTAAEIVRDASGLLAALTASFEAGEYLSKRKTRRGIAIAVVVFLILVAVGLWQYHRISRRQWAREEAIPQITKLFQADKSLAGFLLLQEAGKYLPSDAQIKQLVDDNTMLSSITSSPDGATVEIQDYALPASKWYTVGETPLDHIRIPKGYFRWKVSKKGIGEFITAPLTSDTMAFPLADAMKAPAGMVFSPADRWGDYIGFIGWVGPYNMPAYYADKYEVTNGEYQKFVDSGGYEKKEYWPATFTQNGHQLSWSDAMAEFRDTTGREGPSNWVAGHYPEGKENYPVSGVSWFEASAYAAFAGKSLPVLAQWFQLANPEVAGHAIPMSNIAGHALAPVGTYQGLGSHGTYDMAGNIREWVVNSVDKDLRFILGGSWRSPVYLYYCPEALSPFDRSDTNGFRTVRNIDPIPEVTAQPIRRSAPDFAKLKPISDDIYHAYQLLYAYPKSPLNAKSAGVVKETADWREEKITFDAAYNGERMSAYLYLPKNVKPPYQTVLFFPSARVQFLPAGVVNGELGDTKFFDYVVQSGRAVMYPIYQETYDRRVKFYLPNATQNIDLTTEWYKDAARSLDYLATRADIDSNKLAYLGVSMGSADGLIITTLMQDRLKTAIFLDGGYFLETPPPGGSQADFAPRMKKPVLMVNGMHDFTFSVEMSQNPMFAMLGTPAQDKRHIILDTPHDVTEQRPQLVKAVLDWLDKYLGRVGS